MLSTTANWITIAAAARELSVSRETIEKYIATNVITSRRLPNLAKTQILYADIERIARDGTRHAATA